MNQDKMYLINKLFNDKTIRTVWDKDEEKILCKCYRCCWSSFRK